MRMRRFLAAALAVAMLAGNTMTAFATDVTPVPTNTGAASENNEGTDTPGTPSGEVVVEPTPETTPVVTDAPTPEVTPDAPTPEATPTTPTTGEVTPTVPAEGEVTPSVPVAGEVSPEVTPSEMVTPSVSPELSAAAMQLTKTYVLGDDNREADENVLLTNYYGDERAYYTTVAEAVEAANKKYAEDEKYSISLLPQMVEGSGAENVPLEFEVSVSVLNSIRKKSQLHMGGQILKIVCAENDPIPAIKCDITTIGSENYGSQILKQSEIRVVGSDSLRFVKPDYYDKPVDMEEHVYNNSVRQSISGDIDGLKITFTDTTNPNILIGEEGEPSASNASYACEIDFSNITLPDNCNLTIYDDFSTYNSTSNDLNVAKMVINTGCEYGEDSQLVNSESAYICYDNVTADEIVINGPTTLQANVVTGKLDMNYDVYFRGNLEVTGTFTNHESNAMLHGETRINNLVASKGTLNKSYYRTSFNIESTGSLHIENAMIDSNSKPNNEIIYLTRYPSGPNSAPEEGTVLATIGENCEDKLFAFGNYGGYMLERTEDNKLVLRQATFAVMYNVNGNYYSNYFLSIADVQDFIKTDTSGSSTYGIYLNKDTSVNGDLIFNKDTVGKDNVNITLGLGNHTLTFEEDATVVIDQITGNSEYGTIKVAQDKTLNLKSRSSYKNYYSFMDLYNVNLEFDPASTTGGLVIGDGSKDRGVLFGFTKTNDGKINLPHIYNAQNVDLTITSKFQYGYMADYYYHSNNISLSKEEFDAAGVEFNNIFVDNVSSNITSDFYYDVEFGTAVKVNSLLSANGDFKAYSLETAGIEAFDNTRIAVKAPSRVGRVDIVDKTDADLPEFKNITYYCDNNKASEGLICFSGSINGGAIKLRTGKDKAEYTDEYYRTNYEENPIASGDILATVEGSDESLLYTENYVIEDSVDSFSTIMEQDASEQNKYYIKAYKETVGILVSHEEYEPVLYPSLENMVANLEKDFNKDEGHYCLEIFGNPVLTGNVTIPSFVKELEIISGNSMEDNSSSSDRVLDLNGQAMITSARVILNNNIRIISSISNKGKLTVTSQDDISGQPALVIYEEDNSGTGKQTLSNVTVSVPNGSMLLEPISDEGQVQESEIFCLGAEIIAKNLSINGGNWELPGNITVTNGELSVNDDSKLKTDETITLNNSTTVLGKNAHVVAKNMVLTGSCLNVKDAEVEVEEKINVTKANPAETYGEGTIVVMGDRSRVKASELVMPAGTISAADNAKVLIEKITKANNIRLSSNAGLVCDAITQLDAAKTYMSDGGCLWVGSKGTINNVVLESDGAFLGRAEDAALTVNKSVTGTSEDNRLRVFVTDKEHKYSNTEDLLENLNKVMQCTAEDIVVPESESVLFNTGIAAFPVDRVEVWAWTTPASGQQEASWTENNAVYQSGNKMLVTGKFIEIFAAKANGDGEEYLKGFTTWKEASDYLNTLNNTSATYIVRFGKDIDINQALTLPKNVKSIVIASGKAEDSGNGLEPVPVRLSFIGDLALNTCTEFRDVELCPYVIKNGVTDNNYKATINTNGKDILFSNAQFVDDDYAVKPINTIKGTSTTNITMFDSDLSLASLSGINSITLIDSDITSSGLLSVNTLYVTGMDKSVVKVSGNANLEVKQDLIMEAKTTLDSAGKITLNNIQTENQGNLFRTATNGAITIKGIVSSYDRSQIGLQADIVSSDSGERFNGFKLADENATNVDAWVMNNAIALSYGDMGTPAPQAKLMANAVKAPATFFVASETGFVTGGKSVGTTVAGAVLRKDSGNLYTDYATDNLVELVDCNNDLILGQFETVSQAFRAIDELADTEGEYILNVKGPDNNLDTKGNEVDYKFPTKLLSLAIQGTSEDAALRFKKDIKIGSEVVFKNIDIKPVVTGGTINLGNHPAEFVDSDINPGGPSDVKMNIVGGGVNKGSSITILTEGEERKEFPIGNITNVELVDIGSNITLHINGTANVGNIKARGYCDDKSTWAILKVGVKFTRKNGLVTASSPKLTVNDKISGYNKLVIELYDADDSSATVINSRLDDSEYAKLTGTGGGGLIFAKAAKVETEAISLSTSEPPYVYKKSGNLVAKITEPQVSLSYETEFIKHVSVFDTYADAIAEINSLKNKGDYTLEFIRSDKNAPIELTMPKAGTANSLTLTTSNGQDVPVYYTGNLALTTNVVLKNLDFVQVAKYDGAYSRVDEHNASVKTYSVPVNVSVGGAYTLDINGKVTFNTPINLTGSNKATLDLEGGVIVATARTDGKSASGYNNAAEYSYIEGSVAKFAKINVESDTNITGYFKGSVPESLESTTTMPTYVGVAFSTNDLVVNNSAKFSVGRSGQTVDSLTVGNDCVNAGKITSYGKATLKNLSLTYSGEIDVKGQEFKIKGNVTSLSSGSILYTTVGKKDDKSVLTIDGNVILSDPDNRIGVAVSDTDGSHFKFGGIKSEENNTYYSTRLLTAQKASIDSFEVAVNPNGGLYDENTNTTGYFLKKNGKEIQVYDGEDVAVKLDINGEINYYTSFNEAVAAIDAGSEAVEKCTITLLNHDGYYFENIKLPNKARNLTIMTKGDDPTFIVSSNKLTLSGNVKLKNIAIMYQPEGKSFDIDIKNYQLELEDSGICAGNITGNNKNGSIKLVHAPSSFSDTVLDVNSIKGVNTLDLKDGYVECNGTVNVGSLVGCGELIYGQLTVNNELKRDGSGLLELTKSVAITPAAITGVKASITENNKLATIGNANYVADGVAFKGDNLNNANTVLANGCLYAVDDSIYDRAVDVEYDGKTVKCLDMAQATNLIEKLNVATNDYVIKVGEDLGDTNVTDKSGVSALKLPAKNKAKKVTISSAKVEGEPTEVKPVSISATTCTSESLVLDNVNLTTTGKSSVTALELNNGSWVALGATTVGNINSVTGSNSFLGTYLNKNVPQLTVTGDVNNNVQVKLYDLSTKKEIAEGLDDDGKKAKYSNMPLVIAKKASASRFIASPYAITGTAPEAFGMASGVSAYKNKSNYVFNGDISDMDVILQAKGLDTYVKTYAEAIQIINNISDKNADYVIKLRKTDNNNGEIRTAVDKNGKAVYGALALPAAGKAASLTIESESDKLELLFTGAVSPKCDLTFKNVEITEGKVSKGNFIPNNYITPNYSGVTLTLGDGVTTPGAAESLANDNYLINIGNENAVLPTPSVVINTVKAQDTRSAKGTLALSVSVYVKGKTEIADIRAENDVSLYTKSQTVLGSISGNNKLYLVTAYTDKAGKDWKTSASQLTINGELDSSAQLALVPYYYVLEGSKFLKPFYLDMLHDMAYYGENKPAAYKKLLTAPKLQVGGNNIKLVSGVDHKDVTGYSFVKFGGGVYITDMARAINVKGYSSDDSENPLYIGEFFTWDQAVAEIEKLGHANDKTGSGGWNYEIVLNDSLGIDKPLSSVPMPSKANKVTIKASDPNFGIITTASSVAIKANTDLEIPIVSVKKSGNNYYDVAYTLNTGGFALNINNVPTMANLGGTDRRPLIKLTGNAKGSVDVNMNDNGDEIINQITNIGMVKLNTNNNSECVFLVANGISGVGELVINPNVTVDTVEKDINVKKLTAVGENSGEGTPKTAIAVAKNITVTDTLTIGSAYLRAGTSKSGDGKVTLTNVILKDNANVIEGKQDAKGGSLIQIKGAVVSDGANAGSPAVEIGLYYNNSIKEYVRLSEDMTMLTAPKVATSWFVPAYSTEDSIRMGAEIVEQLATMSWNGEFEKDVEGNVIHKPVRTYGLYKSGNSIKYGRLIDVEQVSINGNAPELVQNGGAEAFLYIGTDHSDNSKPCIAFRTFEEAVKAIDSMALKAADGKKMEQYTIKLNSNVYIGGDNATSKLKALTLPSRTSKLTVEGDSDAGFTKINFNGNITLKSNVTFVSCDLNSIKDAGGEVFSIPVNYAIGNWTLEMLNSSFEASNITGSAKSGTLILKEDDQRYFYKYKVESIKGLNSIILDNAVIISAGDVNVNRVVSVDGENKQGYLGCNGNVVLNSIESNGNNFTMSISSDKTVKINGTQVTDENGNKKYVSNTGSGLPSLRVTEGNKKLAPGTLLISGKYLSDLAGMQIISESEHYNCYVRPDGLYLGNVLWK